MKTKRKNQSLSKTLNRLFPFVIISRKEYEDLNYFLDTTVGLYAIDLNPKDIDYDWIVKNNVRVKDIVTKSDSNRMIGKGAKTFDTYKLSE